MRIAAVIVTFNRRAHLEKTLARVLAEPVDHVLVVDSGSTDGSRDWLAAQTDPRIAPVLLARNGGGALGFETGMREAVARHDPDWILLMDDDARPEPGGVAAFRALPPGADVVAGAARFPAGGICDMNRPWVNPFWQAGTFLKTLRGGRDGFHLGEGDYAGAQPVPIHGASFVGLFLSREAVRRGGYPDGRMFIYGDDVHYTLGLTQRGLKSIFAPTVRFEHDCTTLTRGALFRPIWKTYYHHRNLWMVYRRAAGPVLFWPLIAMMVPKWLLKGRELPEGERRAYRGLTRLAVRDAVLGRMDRTHEEILSRAQAGDRHAPP